ncbi:cation:proton antiporter [Streptomyces chengbuensis]|uniref:cation:proton antiporter domain-containing protein n=1 Tax=Streptomyces chengbuensis TaxID=3053466 RepID=UPI0025B2D545|nr:cation:proton antiporter [Streptomyces sp. HUAS CB01]WJY54203.1 cation:proton antiporter [Streptomyces sp. HUAS CB01]
MGDGYVSGGNALTGVAVAVVTAGYALVSRRIAATVVTAPLFFTACGVLIGPAGLGLFGLEHSAGPVLVLVETALALVLFTDAMSLRGRQLHRGRFLPVRLLAIGLPLTIAAGWLLAWPLLPGLTVWELALIATILAPTDAAVCRTALSSPRVPPLVRSGLNAECGIGDGIVLPVFVLLLAALPGAAEEDHVGIFWRSLVLSAALGVACGVAAALLLRRAGSAGWVSREGNQLMILSTVLASFALARLVDGSGFIAVWAAGIAFAVLMRRDVPAETSPEGARSHGFAGGHEFTENVAALLAAMSFLVFGAVLLGPALEHLDRRTVAYALLSLTVVRMVPVALALAGSGLRLPTVAYVGWFGPRGLASLVLALLVVKEYGAGAALPGRVVAVTVGLSVLAHGVTSVLLSERYGAWYAKASGRDPGLRERVADGEPAG